MEIEQKQEQIKDESKKEEPKKEEQKPAGEPETKKEETPAIPSVPKEEPKIDMERVSKLEKYRNENMLKNNGFLPQHNQWVQYIMEKEGKSFDDSDIDTYLKKEEFNIFKNSTIIDSSNIVNDKKDNSTTKEETKPKTDEEIEKTIIEIPEK